MTNLRKVYIKFVVAKVKMYNWAIVIHCHFKGDIKPDTFCDVYFQ